MTQECKQRLREQIPKLPDHEVMWLRKFCEAVLIKRDLEWENVPISKVEEVIRDSAA
jgi:hypothetical protein